jgi:hypothetical protein
MSTPIPLDAIPEHRRDAVARWLSTSVGDCGSCSQPVLTVHPRRTTKDGGLVHISCESVSARPDTTEVVSKNVEANAARSDWG